MHGLLGWKLLRHHGPRSTLGRLRGRHLLRIWGKRLHELRNRALPGFYRRYKLYRLPGGIVLRGHGFDCCSDMQRWFLFPARSFCMH